ncbi:hypothetical protein SAY86_000055 [Trapa natans]|uniref:Uncharacterized protein n=1 Tax=Trapa natans TaxID=22666 RepID=A0AAN7MBE9_TRANT|nr:hypothetical protein SAY86_000055 [Trapa natans]
MNEFILERLTSQVRSETQAPWKNLGASMNAISFGLIATAALILIFLIMAIFEHLFRPAPSLTSSQDDMTELSPQWGPSKKVVNQNPVQPSLSYASILMPGQNYPTYVAHPAPLPCQREGIHWPPHEQSLLLSPSD